MPKIAPASGVPNTDANPALMPAISKIRLSCAASLSGRDSWSASEAPVCIAVPSRPAEPPNTCVTNVPIRISGVIRIGIVALGSCVSSRIRLLPASTDEPTYLYIRPTSHPAGASSRISHT